MFTNFSVHPDLEVGVKIRFSVDIIKGPVLRGGANSPGSLQEWM